MPRRRRLATLALAALILTLAAPASGSGSRIGVNEQVSLHPVGGSPGNVTERGSASGTVQASASASLRRSGSSFSGSLGLNSRAGWLGGSLSGTLTRRSSSSASFNGTLRVTGTGRYRRSSGTLHVSGTLSTRNLGISMHLAGSLSA